MNIDRYDLEDVSQSWAYHSYYEMVAAPDLGDWVKYEDHVKIVKQLEETIKELQNKVAQL